MEGGMAKDRQRRRHRRHGGWRTALAQEQPRRISKLDSMDRVSVALAETHGVGSIAIDSKDGSSAWSAHAPIPADGPISAPSRQP